MIPEWLKAICPEDRPHIGKPFALDLNGERWVCATDGRMAVAIRSDADAPDGDKLVASTLRHYMQFPTPHVVAMSALQMTRPSVLGPEECGKCKDGKIACVRCDGTGEIEGDAPCAECGCTDDECEVCDGEGKADCDCSGAFELRPHLVSVNDEVVFNARFLWCALAHLEGDLIRVWFGGDLDPLVFVTDAWRIVVMPTRHPVNEAVVRLRIGSAEREASA